MIHQDIPTVSFLMANPQIRWLWYPVLPLLNRLKASALWTEGFLVVGRGPHVYLSNIYMADFSRCHELPTKEYGSWEDVDAEWIVD
mgnify:CR=1 FL=1